MVSPIQGSSSNYNVNLEVNSVQLNSIDLFSQDSHKNLHYFEKIGSELKIIPLPKNMDTSQIERSKLVYKKDNILLGPLGFSKEMFGQKIILVGEDGTHSHLENAKVFDRTEEQETKVQQIFTGYVANIQRMNDVQKANQAAEEAMKKNLEGDSYHLHGRATEKPVEKHSNEAKATDLQRANFVFSNKLAELETIFKQGHEKATKEEKREEVHAQGKIDEHQANNEQALKAQARFIIQKSDGEGQMKVDRKQREVP